MMFSDRGQAKLALGDCAGANGDYTRSLALDKDPEMDDFNYRGTARLCSGDTQGALEDYRKVVAMKPPRERAKMDVLAFNAWAAGVFAGKKAEADKMLSAQLSAAKPSRGRIDQDCDAAWVLLGHGEMTILTGDAKSLKMRDVDDADAFDSEAFYCSALKHVADGDFGAARTAFTKVLALKMPADDLQTFSRAWLKAMARKPGR